MEQCQESEDMFGGRVFLQWYGVWALLVLVGIKMGNALVGVVMSRVKQARDPYKEKKALLDSLLKEAELTNTPSMFVEHTKIKRRIAVLRKEIPEGYGGPLAAAPAAQGKTLEYLASAILVWFCWGVPVACVPFIPPTLKMFNYSGTLDGGLAIIPWLMLCSSAIDRCVEVSVYLFGRGEGKGKSGVKA